MIFEFIIFIKFGKIWPLFFLLLPLVSFSPSLLLLLLLLLLFYVLSFLFHEIQLLMYKFLTISHMLLRLWSFFQSFFFLSSLSTLHFGKFYYCVFKFSDLYFCTNCYLTTKFLFQKFHLVIFCSTICLFISSISFIMFIYLLHPWACIEYLNQLFKYLYLIAWSLCHVCVSTDWFFF